MNYAGPGGTVMEGSRIEYKRALTDGPEREVVAFLNYKDGGVIYIGIAQDGQIYGAEDADGVQLAVKDRLRNNIQPSIMGIFDIIHEIRDHKNIIRITVAGGLEKPYYLRKYGMTEKGCFMRVGSSAEPMPREMLKTLFDREFATPSATCFPRGRISALNSLKSNTIRAASL